MLRCPGMSVCTAVRFQGVWTTEQLRCFYHGFHSKMGSDQTRDAKLSLRTQSHNFRARFLAATAFGTVASLAVSYAAGLSSSVNLYDSPVFPWLVQHVPFFPIS